jgi:hypothetical protein
MKKLILLIAFVAAAAAFGQSQTIQCQASNGAWGPCPFVAPVTTAQAVNSKISAGAGTTITNAFGSSTTAGNSILCVGMESAAAIPVITDGQSNTYIVAASSATAPGYTVSLASNIVGGTTDTITSTVTSGAASFSCYELKGSVSVGQIWDYVNGQQATSTTLTFGTQSAFQPNEFAVVAVGMGAGTVNATPSIASVPAGLTTVDQSNTTPSGGSALSVFYSAHAIVTNQPTFTQTVSLSASETYSAVLVSVKPIAAPSGGISALPLPGFVVSGQQAVTASAVALSNVTLTKGICVEALSTNSISVFIGPSTVSTTTGIELPAKASYCVSVSNANQLFVIASTTGASVTWSGN